MAGAEAEGRRESEAEAEDEWASEAEGVPLTPAFTGLLLKLQELCISKDHFWIL